MNEHEEIDDLRATVRRLEQDRDELRRQLSNIQSDLRDCMRRDDDKREQVATLTAERDTERLSANDFGHRLLEAEADVLRLRQELERIETAADADEECGCVICAKHIPARQRAIQLAHDQAEELAQLRTLRQLNRDLQTRNGQLVTLREYADQEAAQLRMRLAAIVEELKVKAYDSNEEGRRINRTVHASTDAEERCYARAQAWIWVVELVAALDAPPEHTT